MRAVKSPALSPRMMAVAALIPDDGVVADIGADHGRLSVWLASRGRRVIAVDISARSLAKAAALASRCGVAERVACRPGDGLEPLEPGEAQTAVLAGMGGRTMEKILSSDPVKTRTLHLVLQPMNAGDALRSWLSRNGFGITGEGYGVERGSIRPVFRARYGQVDPGRHFDCLIGNWELASEHPLFGTYLIQEAGRCRALMACARRGKKEASARRFAELERQLALYEGAMAWLAQHRKS
ncbi:MAG: tRNA (adenine(22)-N(1))-methyltransferase [Christensenellales bacterium]